MFVLDLIQILKAQFVICMYLRQIKMSHISCKEVGKEPIFKGVTPCGAHEMFTTKLFRTNTPIDDISDGLKAGGL